MPVYAGGDGTPRAKHSARSLRLWGAPMTESDKFLILVRRMMLEIAERYEKLARRLEQESG